MNKTTKLSYRLILITYCLFTITSCSVNKQISRQATSILLRDTAISKGHIGISIFEPATGKYWYDYNGDKYFIPASNTKIFSLYAGMKYIGDSIVGLRYKRTGDTTFIIPAGDPTFLLPEYPAQPVFEFLSQQNNLVISQPVAIKAYGNGWAWNDYQYDYMTPRSVFPMYGNLLTAKWIAENNLLITPSYFQNNIPKGEKFTIGFTLTKSFDQNNFRFSDGKEKNRAVPFYPDQTTLAALLRDTLTGKKLPGITTTWFKGTPVYSRPADSMFKPMMHRSDNFFAEQTLLMASNERLGYMSETDIIDTLLHDDLKNIPQVPRWVDGSGLSRYNLFTPQGFVYILGKLINEFGWDRIKNILPTGGEGTITNYYKSASGFIYAKTGTLSNNCALSGYLITKKNKVLIFSVLANNYQTSSTPVRRAVEKFLLSIRDSY